MFQQLFQDKPNGEGRQEARIFVATEFSAPLAKGMRKHQQSWQHSVIKKETNARIYNHHNGEMMRGVLATAVASVAALSGCASIVGGTNQVISVQTVKGADELAGAACKLENDKGTWFVRTPGTVTVHRAYGDLNIKCEKDGIDPGLATVKSSTKGMAFGNILFGGVIGTAVDMSSGAAYDYPPLITVSMGLTTIIEQPKKAPDGNAGQPAGAPAATSATPTAQAPASSVAVAAASAGASDAAISGK
ncbi:hypothetical protein [Paraburkholderia caballeronis]|uniref:hypothetical protein n=1 Tax=Paraburkholderia caballeronis TaxID=416943 RepID=UPI001AB04B55|nr:hypothetical protein [Paraburkholderia caballeronis]